MSNNDLSNMDKLIRSIVHPYQSPLSPIDQQPSSPAVTPVRIPTSTTTSPEPMPTLSEPESIPHPNPPSPPPQLTLPQPPVSLPSLPTENFGASVSVSDSYAHEHVVKQENEEEIGKMSVDQLGAHVYHHYKVLGQAVYNMSSSLKDKAEKLLWFDNVTIQLKGEKERLNNEVMVLQGKVELLNGNIDGILKRAEEEVQQIKFEKENLQETVSTNETKINELEVKVFNLQLSERQFQKLLEDKEKENDLLKTKVSEYEKQINKQQDEVYKLLTSKKRLIKKVDDQKKKNQSLNEDLNHKSKLFSELNTDFREMNFANTKLQDKIDSFVKTDKANRSTIRDLKSKREKLKLSVEDRDRKLLEKSEEISRISRELENERHDNQVKTLELEKTSKRIQDLNEELKDLQKEKDELPKNFNAFVSQFWVSTISKTGRKRSLSSVSSSSENETPLESLSLSMGAANNTENKTISEDNQTEQLEFQEDVPLTVTTGKRKHPIENSDTGKKQRGDGDALLIPQNSYTGGNVEIPEVSTHHEQVPVLPAVAVAVYKEK